MKRILLVDLDAFFVSVETAANPLLRQKPVIVGCRQDARGVVASASYEARASGVRAGMPLKKAFKLCPEAIFIQGDFEKYRQASRAFMEILNEFSPDLEPESLDEAYLELTDQDPVATALEIKEQVRNRLGLPSSIGIGSSKLIAKIACELSKPNGLFEVAPGSEKEFLEVLPVDRLPGVGPKRKAILKKMGINTIGELSKMPLSILRDYFGSYGTILHDFSLGLDNRTLEPPAPMLSLSHQITFPADTRDISYILGIASLLSQKVAYELRLNKKQGRCIFIKVKFADFATISRQKMLGSPVNDDNIIYNTARGLLEKVVAENRQPLRLVGIGVSHFSESSQLRLTDDYFKACSLNKAVDKIRTHFGFSAINTGRTLVLKKTFDKKMTQEDII